MVTSTSWGMSDDTPERSSLCAVQPAGTVKAQPRAAAWSRAIRPIGALELAQVSDHTSERARPYPRDRHGEAIGTGREKQQLGGERSILLAVEDHVQAIPTLGKADGGGGQHPIEGRRCLGVQRTLDRRCRSPGQSSDLYPDRARFAVLLNGDQARDEPVLPRRCGSTSADVA